MSKFRVFITLLVFLVAGYWLWHHFQQPAGSREFRLRPDTISSQGGDEDLTAYESLQQDIRSSYSRLHSPLDQALTNESKNLNRLWERADNEHKNGNVTLEEARMVSKKITELIRMDEERQKMAVRMKEINQRTHARFESTSQVSDQDRQNFARQALLRQWEEWKDNNQRRFR